MAFWFFGVLGNMDARKFNKLISRIETQKAFSVLYEYYFPKIVSHIYFQFKKRELGEDVAQEFFLKLLHKKPSDYIEHPNAWVYVSCDNIAKDFLSDEKRYNMAYSTAEVDKQDELFKKVLYGEYRQQIEQLDEDTRRIILMYFYEGYSLKEIAATLEINYSTVRQKCSRGLKKLKKI